MAVAAGHEKLVSDEVEQRRLLADVFHLRDSLQPDGSIDAGVLQDTLDNRFTDTQEIGMPGAVTTTVHRLEVEQDEDGRARRVARWLGKSAVGMVLSGYQFYVSEAGKKRGDVEVAEARYAEVSTEAGRADVFISPQMSQYDAPVDVAKAENLYGQDAIRVSYAVTDKSGAIVARRLESLLVSDVPLEAWTAMLQDPGNLFGKSLPLRDERSALSVMELFREMALPEDELPEGPVTIVQSVLPYISDPASRQSVERQIARFQQGQDEYRRKAEAIAGKWRAFDVELARSLKRGTATRPVEEFIGSMQHSWGADDLNVINGHDVMGGYIMTAELAVVLEKAQRYLLSAEAGLATDNEKLLKQTDRRTAQDLRERIGRIEEMRTQGATPAEIALHQAELHRLIARQNFKLPGGCSGGSAGNFENGQGDGQAGDSRNGENSNSSEDSSSWKWTRGVCRVKKCGSPQPTEVGPCSVCRNCQHKFDKGQDPTAGSDPVTKRPEKPPAENLLVLLRAKPDLPAKKQAPKQYDSPRAAGKYALAA